MSGASLDNILWASGTLLFATLALVLLLRRVSHRAPLFTLWINFAWLGAVALYLIKSTHSDRAYFLSFWGVSVLDFLLQIGVVIEFANKAFQHGEAWEIKTRRRFWEIFGLALAVSIAFTLEAVPFLATKSDLLLARLELFSSILVFLLSVGTLSLSYWSNRFWTQRDSAYFSGFLFWATISACTDAAHIYWRTSGHFFALETFRVISSQLIVSYWIICSLSKKAQAHYVTREHIAAFAALYEE